MMLAGLPMHTYFIVCQRLLHLLLLLFFCTGFCDGKNEKGGNTPEGYTVCPRLVSTDTSVQITSRDNENALRGAWRELSGLAASPTQKRRSTSAPVFYAIADGGKGASFGIWDSLTGIRLRTLRLPNKIIFNNTDWEAMAIGPCGSSNDSQTCVYIADVGDNFARTSGGDKTHRDHTIEPYRILKIKEPVLANTKDMDLIPETDIEVLPFRYDQETVPPFEGPYHDCEAMFIDQVGSGRREKAGDLYLVTKWSNNKALDRTRLYRIPVDAWSLSLSSLETQRNENPYDVDQYYTAKTVGTYSKRSQLAKFDWVTSASMSFDGTVIALGNTVETYLYLRCPGASVAETLARGNTKYCLRYKNPSQGQGEAFTWMPGDQQSLNIPEGRNKPMGYANYDYDIDRTTQICPVVKEVEMELGTFCLDDLGNEYPPRRCRAQSEFPPLAPIPPPTNSPNMLR